MIKVDKSLTDPMLYSPSEIHEMGQTKRAQYCRSYMMELLKQHREQEDIFRLVQDHFGLSRSRVYRLHLECRQEFERYLAVYDAANVEPLRERNIRVAEEREFRYMDLADGAKDDAAKARFEKLAIEWHDRVDRAAHLDKIAPGYILIDAAQRDRYALIMMSNMARFTLAQLEDFETAIRAARATHEQARLRQQGDLEGLRATAENEEDLV